MSPEGQKKQKRGEMRASHLDQHYLRDHGSRRRTGRKRTKTKDRKLKDAFGEKSVPGIADLTPYFQHNWKTVHKASKREPNGK